MRGCTVCREPETGLAISKALLKNVSMRELVSQYPGLSLSAIHRHSNNCLNRRTGKSPTPEPGRATKRIPVRGSGSNTISDKREVSRLGDPLETMEADLIGSAQSARNNNDLRLAIQCDALRLKVLDLRAREREKARSESADTTGFEHWTTEALQALEGVRKGLEDGSVTVGALELFLNAEKKLKSEA